VALNWTPTYTQKQAPFDAEPLLSSSTFYTPPITMCNASAHLWTYVNENYSKQETSGPPVENTG